MKISKQTVEILKNYAQINSNILFRGGNQISTISVGRNIYSKATVAEDFPIEFGLYDLNNFLGLLTLSDDSEIEFGESSLTLSKDGGTFEYFYTDPSIIVAPPNKEIKIDSHYEFELPASEIQTITRAASVTNATTISVVADGKNATLIVGDPLTPSSNSYRKVLSDTELEFDCRLSIDNFKVLGGESYSCFLSQKKFMSLKAKSRELQYWLSLDSTSTI